MAKKQPTPPLYRVTIHDTSGTEQANVFVALAPGSKSGEVVVVLQHDYPDFTAAAGWTIHTLRTTPFGRELEVTSADGRILVCRSVQEGE